MNEWMNGWMTREDIAVLQILCMHLNVSLVVYVSNSLDEQSPSDL